MTLGRRRFPPREVKTRRLFAFRATALLVERSSPDTYVLVELWSRAMTAPRVARPLLELQRENATLPSWARELLQRVEARLLLAAQRGIELVQGGLDQLGGLKHGLEPVLHRLQSSDRRQRHIVRTGCL